jgi:predicted nucleic acid-binding protein
MTLALEMPGYIVLLDDMLARRTAHAAGLTVWGTLRILLEMKARGLLTRIEPSVDQLSDAGLWMTADIRQRILALAGEHPSPADN